MKTKPVMHAIEIDSHRGGRCFYAGIYGVTTTDFKHAFKRSSLPSVNILVLNGQFKNLNPKIVSQ